MKRTPGSKRLLFLSVLGAAVCSVAPAALACNSSGYTYAGLASSSKAHGVGARLTAIGGPHVSNGHVAGWVGVGGPGEGPNGADEWIQVGFSGFAGSPNSDLYYEITRAGFAPRYYEVETGLRPGTSRRLAVLEVARRPNTWRVWVNGKPVSRPIYLPRSHGAWRGIATAESWSTNRNAACNAFGYRFDDVKIAQQAGGAWRTLSDALPIRTGVNRLLRPGAGSFEAISGRLLLIQPTPVLPPSQAKPVYIAGTMQRSLSSGRVARER